MPGFQSMKSSLNRMRLRSLFWVVIGLVLVSQFPGDSVRAAPSRAVSVSVSLSNPACVSALPASGVCLIKFYSLTASGSDTSFSRVEVLVNGKLRVEMAGFFESFAYLTYPMLPRGLAVTCGRPNDGGKPNFGRSYSLTANAYMVDGTAASGTVTVFCPPYDGKVYLPILRK
jgi:hypothetical protein